MTFTPAALAKELRVSRSKVMGWIHSGQLVAFDVGDGDKPRYRIDEEAVREFQEKRRVKPPDRRDRRIVRKTKKEWF